MLLIQYTEGSPLIARVADLLPCILPTQVKILESTYEFFQVSRGTESQDCDEIFHLFNKRYIVLHIVIFDED